MELTSRWPHDEFCRWHPVGPPFYLLWTVVGPRFHIVVTLWEPHAAA